MTLENGYNFLIPQVPYLHICLTYQVQKTCFMSVVKELNGMTVMPMK